MKTLQRPVPTARRDHADDDVWIRQTLEGKSEAFGRLMEKYKDVLFDLACRILGNRSEAEDALQDSFVEAYRHLADFNHQSRFSTWLYAIVLNRVRNRLRHNRIIKWYSLDMPRETEEGPRPIEFPEKKPAVERLTEKKMELEAVQKEVHKLPVLYQSIFILHYFQDMPLKEIAQRIDRPIGTIKVYLHRARKLLYKRIVKTTQKQPAGPSAYSKPSTSQRMAVHA
jgi:RNA polymerase sigma-70 factor (ECF subfamily)